MLGRGQQGAAVLMKDPITEELLVAKEVQIDGMSEDQRKGVENEARRAATPPSGRGPAATCSQPPPPPARCRPQPPPTRSPAAHRPAPRFDPGVERISRWGVNTTIFLTPVTAR